MPMMSSLLRNSFYRRLGVVLAPRKDPEGQLTAAMEVINQIDELNLSHELQSFFERCKTKPWMLDVFKLLKDRKRKTAYEQREAKGVRQRYQDPAAEFFRIVKTPPKDGP